MARCSECGDELPEGIEKVIDPYQQDIFNKEVWRYLCEICIHILKDEI